MLLAVDWSGDPGVTAQASRRCIMAVAACESEAAIEASLHALRDARRLPHGYEFHFTKTHRHEALCAAFMDAVARLSFTASVVVLDKDAMGRRDAWGESDVLLGRLLALALLQLPREVVEGSKLLIDGGAETKKLKAIGRPMLSKAYEARHLDYRIGKIAVGDSASSNAIQLVDMVAGAVNYALEDGPKGVALLKRLGNRPKILTITPDMEKPVK